MKMRSIFAVVVLVLVAGIGSADECEYEYFGDWAYAEVEPTLMDEGYEVIIWQGDEQTVSIGVTAQGLGVVISFDAFIGGSGKFVEADVWAVSDVMELDTLPRAFVSIDSTGLVWAGTAARQVLAFFHGASEVMLRTENYRGVTVDFVARLKPDDFAAAWERLGVDEDAQQ